MHSVLNYKMVLRIHTEISALESFNFSSSVQQETRKNILNKFHFIRQRNLINLRQVGRYLIGNLTQ